MPLFLGQEKISQVTVSVESADGGINTNDATLTSGGQMLSGVTAYSNGKKYTGTIATVNGPSPSISVSNDGVITASVSNPKGYQSSATTKTTTSQLNTKEATTVTPSNLRQTVVSSGVYTTGDIVVSAVPTETKTITANGTYTPSSGKYFSSIEVDIAGDIPTYQSKTVTPSTSVQTITADDGYDALSDVTVNAIRTETKSVTPTTSAQTVKPTSGSYLTQVSVGAISTETKSITSNGTYNPTSGKYFSSVTVNIPAEEFNTQSKTVTPTESTQTISPDNGYEGLSSVTVNPISSTYVGSGVPTKGATTITPNSNSQIAISSGTYATGNITVSSVPTETKSITANGTYTPSNGKYFSSVSVSVVGDTFDTQEKTVTPTESEQVIGPDAGYDGLSSVTVGAISSTYVGTGITRKSAATITPSESVQTIAANQYLTGVQTISAIPSDYVGSDVTRKSAATITPTESEQVISSGQYLEGTQTISAIPSNYVGSGVTTKGATTITPSTSIQTAVSAGTYVTGDIKVSAMTRGELKTPTINSSGLVTAGVKTSGYLDTSKTSTLQLTTKGATTITPSTSVQTAIASGTYATGDIKVAAMPNGALGTPSVNNSGLVTASVATSGYLADTTTKTLQLNTKGATTITPTTSSQVAVSAGNYVTGDITVDAIPSDYIDTSDADAVASDIVLNKTAYVNGTKITGERKRLSSFLGTGSIANNPYIEFDYISRDGTASSIGQACIHLNITDNFYANQGDTTYLGGFLVGTTTADKVLAGETFTSVEGANLTGTMPSKEAATITPTTTNQIINAGQYLTGAQTIQGDANLIPENIASGVSIFGVTGTHQGGSGTDTSDATATEADIVNGKTAYINGGKVTGTLVVQNYYTGTTTPQSTTGKDGDLYFKVVR